MQHTNIRLEEMYLEVTNQCPQQCLHCSARSGLPYPDELTRDEMVSIVRQAKVLGLENLLITGGEPLSRPNKVLALLEECKDIKIIQVLTSGIPLHENWADALQEYRENVVVEISIFSADPELHDQMTQFPGSLGRILDATSLCIDRDVSVNWEFVVTSMNLSEIHGIVELAGDYGVGHVSLLRLSPTGRARDNLDFLDVTFDEFTQFMANIAVMQANGFSVRTGGPISFSFIECGTEPKPCSAAVDKLFVQADGTTLPCPAFKDLSNYSGYDARNTSIRDIWDQSPAFDRLRRFLLEDDVNICPTCEYSRKCRGRCVAQRLHYYGDNLDQGPDPLCPLAVKHAVQKKLEMLYP